MSALDLLTIFRDELPDRYAQLYRGGTETVTFASFRDLPDVVKVMIWNLARPRTVLATMDRNGVLHSHTPTPVTFRVCKEARTSTIRHYKIPRHLMNYDAGQSARTKSPNAPLHKYFFDPKVDTLMLAGRNPSDISCYYQHCMSGISEDFTLIRSLQVRRFDWGLLMFKGWKNWSEGQNPHFTYFRCFSGLESLTIVAGGEGLRTDDEQEDCKRALTRVFNDFNTIFGDYKIPRVYIKKA